MIKRSERHRVRGGSAAAQEANSSIGSDRRTFLKRSGVAVGALAALGDLPLGGIRKAEAGPPLPAGATVTDSKELMYTLLGGVLGYRRGRKRRLDRSGTGL